MLADVQSPCFATSCPVLLQVDDLPLLHLEVDIHAERRGAYAWLGADDFTPRSLGSIFGMSLPAGIQLEQLHFLDSTLSPGLEQQCGSRLAAVTLLRLDRCQVDDTGNESLVAAMPQLQTLQLWNLPGLAAVPLPAALRRLELRNDHEQILEAITTLTALTALVGGERLTTLGLCCNRLVGVQLVQLCCKQPCPRRFKAVTDSIRSPVSPVVVPGGHARV